VTTHVDEYEQAEVEMFTSCQAINIRGSNDITNLHTQTGEVECK